MKLGKEKVEKNKTNKEIKVEGGQVAQLVGGLILTWATCCTLATRMKITSCS